ncbi:DNA primase family protein [Sphingomonas hengshuiensis]|uniref:DNA primase family protein n=1 Tax=Sphingomonas hengshuiensis TaxID=1609977 RepID=UPI000698DB29|nr:phage/plasmid primase, P4 family [Sphingomonas hengshuiensis]
MADRDSGPLVPDGGPESGAALRRSRRELNDRGNAYRLADVAAGKLLFVGELGRAGEWVHFNSQRWSLRDGKARALSLAMAVCDAIMDEARAVRMASPDELRAVYGPKFTAEMADERAVQLFAWAMKSGNSERCGGMLKQAQGIVDDQDRFLMRAALEDFDCDPLAFHCRNGTVRFKRDLMTGKWVPRFDQGHRPGDMFMRMAEVDFVDGAQAPKWTERLVLLHTDPVARTAFKRIYGMCTTALISDQAFYVYQGKGGDGKSLTNKVVGELMGDYFLSASPQTFLESKEQNSASHQSDIVRLRGDVRLVVIDEPRKGSTWSSQRIKQVTGSNVTARGAHAVEEITFRPHFKLIAECNNMPRAPSDDRGFRRRLKLYPWTVQFGVTPGVEDRPEDEVAAELRAEASGILNWMIEGACEWLECREIPEPEMSRRAMSSFWATGSAMSEWIEARCTLTDPEASSGATDLYQDFKEFCRDVRGDKDEAILSQTRFGTLLNELQVYADKDSAGRKVRRGIRLCGVERSGALGGTDWIVP